MNHCSNHGVCVDHDKCECDLGWAGINCTLYSCELNGYCSGQWFLGVTPTFSLLCVDFIGQGRCVGFDVCQCDVGWAGGSCTTPLCNGVDECFGNGECVSHNVCQCYDGYSGSNCAVADVCPEVNDCSGNGVCLSKTKCRCYSGYSGKNCSQAQCKGRNDCSGHGKCIEVDLCECEFGYTDSNCSSYSCETHNFCSGQSIARRIIQMRVVLLYIIIFFTFRSWNVSLV